MRAIAAALSQALLGVAWALTLSPSLCHGAGSTADGDDDASCSSTTARLVLSSERTQAGDWVARVRLVHDDGDPGSWERWRVAAEHRVEACEGDGTRVLMEANITIPRSALRNPPFGHGARRGGSSATSASSGGLLPSGVGAGRNGTGGDADGSGSGDAAPPDKIPAGYAAIPRLGSAYRYRDEWLVWADARAACEAEGSHLVVPSTEDEYNVLAKMSSKHPWVGVFYDKERGRYVTVNDEPIEDLTYVRWGAGEPDKSGDCIFFQSLTKSLYDEPCGFVEVFVCETPLYGVYEEQPEPPTLVTQL